MGPLGYPITETDATLIAVLAEAPWHLDLLARSGKWDARCDRVAHRIAYYGLGRN